MKQLLLNHQLHLLCQMLIHWKRTICGAVDLKFKEAVEAMSGGTITIDLQGSGVLGAEADILDGMLGVQERLI